MKRVNKKVLLPVIVLVGVTVGAAIALNYPSQDTETMTGIVTSKFTDCVGGKEMDPQGNIVPIRDVSCDGGSMITLDYKNSFVTATGYVPSDEAYSVDVSDIKVGDKVTVVYEIDPRGATTLNCPDCGVTRQE